jgi:anaerobic ribonucleoside-triphosphate reductase activating protein
MDLNVAAYRIGTKALGPGIRSVVWVQGCPFHCEGCFSPNWIKKQQNEAWAPLDLAKMLVFPEMEGITISGGEPMDQADGVLELIQDVKKINSKSSIVIYTGYTIATLRKRHAGHPIHELLRTVDVLIDGLYVQQKNDNKGLRGSNNQKIHHLTDRYLNFDFENDQRIQEYYIRENEIQIVGIPDQAGGFFVKNDLADIVR